MSRRRYISTLASIDKTLRSCTDAAVMFYLMMLPHVEDDATITADIEELSATVVPNRPGWSYGKVEKVVGELQAKGLLIYHEGLLYLPPNSFYKYQSNIPEAKRRSWHPEQVHLENACSEAFQKKIPEVAQNSASPSPSLSPSPSKHMSTFVDEFDSFWSMYPRKTGKGKARESYRTARKKASAGEIAEGLERQLSTFAASEIRFVPLPATWLNQERWTDEGDPKPGEKVVDLKARRQRIENAKSYLAMGDEDTARAMCNPDEWNEVIGRSL